MTSLKGYARTTIAQGNNTNHFAEGFEGMDDRDMRGKMMERREGRKRRR